jgi:hypothetical protein
MSQPTDLLFTVALRHLSADGKRAGTDLPPIELNHISAKQLRSLLQGLEAQAPRIVYPTEPEVRITGATGKFVVQVKANELHLVSWSSAHKGGVVTTSQIMDAVTGADASEAAAPVASAKARKSAASGKEKLTLIGLGLAILAVNAFTIWFLTRPPRTLLGNYRLIPTERAKRVLENAVGAYETGKGPGDRRLEIGADAEVKRIKYGNGGTVKDFQTFNVQPVEADGKLALLTSPRKTIIQLKDNISVVLYGDTYTRVKN